MPRLQGKNSTENTELQKRVKTTILLPNSFENIYLKYQLQEFQKVKVVVHQLYNFLIHILRR
jgi:hypothetical protein